MAAPAAAVLRPAVRDDVPELLTLIRELADDGRLEHEGVADAAVLADSLFGERPAAEAVIADVEGAAAGFALFFQSVSTSPGRQGLYLEDLYVRPAHRGLGLGRTLMRHMAQLAMTRGCARFEWSVMDWNRDALAFYRSLGAVGMDGWAVQRADGEALHRLAAAA
ncbi:GNAT family N-acetyltransferase [Luteimonas abyssi]|uniref:GNAT family N-acetyltransferase n=1 Tax=Luteimonas abyssi TaxID=1247514 RepID=UPI000737D38D|nr:GNAT family N-acetyltransferase [Luteimonas abyssi]